LPLNVLLILHEQSGVRLHYYESFGNKHALHQYFYYFSVSYCYIAVMKHFILSLSVLLLLIVACSKKPTSTTTQENTLRGARWKVSGGTFTMKAPNGIDTSIPYTGIIPTCHQNDYLVFDSAYSGAIYSGSNKCIASEADSIRFNWNITNNGKNINFYNVFNFVFADSEMILPYRFDTAFYTPPYFVDKMGDTIKYHFDTARYDTPYTVVLPPTDTIKYYFDTIWPCNYNPYQLDYQNIYANLTALSSSSFTIQYQWTQGMYWDTTKLHEYAPIRRPDTFTFKVTYSSF
jgi:hypothetical protein